MKWVTTLVATATVAIGSTSGAVADAQGHRAPDTTIAAGAYATLTLDNAMAFIDALEFVLAQIGYEHQFTDTERQEAVAAIAASFPYADQVDQVVLAQARTIWERVKSNWDTAAVEDQREFALGVLVLAFGEEAVATWIGPAGAQTRSGTDQGLGSASQCTTFEDCTGNFVGGQTWSDTFNSQGCWAAAGCSSFDPTTNSFDYGDY